ncbi:unnamed protein product [Linum tenue]|uniref:Uncharacterized protein n=1 Tax=Linum tenue TaxID=586396 RepID=A0AAV0JSJ8_9ROSI|nr:unnamed protein product [Linum tenue]
MAMNDEVESKTPKLEVLEGSEPVSRCYESEEMIKNAEVRIRGLEREIETRKSEYQELEGKYKALQLRIVEIEDELKALKAREVEEEDNELFHIENVTLECEKKKAESEVEIGKRKYQELKSIVGRITNNIEDGHVAAGATSDIYRTPCSNLPSNDESLFGGNKSRGRSGRQARRHVLFEKEKDSIRKKAPTTPTDPKVNWSGIINIDDSDDEPNFSDEKEKSSETRSKSRVNDFSLNDSMDVCVGTNLCATATPKRKRAANVVATDSESEDDDIPLSQRKAKRFRKVSCDANGLSKAASLSASDDDDVRDTVTPRRRRLKRMGDSSRKSDSQQLASIETNCESKYERGIPTTADGAEDSDSTTDEEEGSGSSDDSMKEFIVESSNASLSDGDTCSTEGSADIGVEMKDIVSKLQRSRNQKFNWESVGELQSDFGKDNELCMRAVCALYRQQTCDEQVAKNTFHSNKRGFSQSHGSRASKIAAFLIDSNGDLSKSVEELRAYDPKAVDKCRDWALHYANQLFNIYKSGEDPFFPPAVDNK